MAEATDRARARRPGPDARERVLTAARQLFREQGINSTGMDQLSAHAHVSKRTIYQQFASKDGLITEYLRRQDPAAMPDVFDRPGLAPRDRLLAAFEWEWLTRGEPTPLCPYIGAAVEISDPAHPARALARDYKRSIATRFETAARDAGAADPELLGEQLALLLDGASVRTRTMGTDASSTALGVATVLVDRALGGEP